MGTESAGSAGTTAAGRLDVLIVGAGLSGIGAACHLQADAPGTSYAILEARGASGGTWDLFRFPGVRSDSDMFTLSYPFRPWKQSKSIAGGGEILRYLRETAAAFGVDKQISYHSRVVSADWSSDDAQVDGDGRAHRHRRAHRAHVRLPVPVPGLLPLRRGLHAGLARPGETSPGRSCTRSTGRRTWTWRASGSCVIGSGATAVTIVPAIAGTAAQVTMLQRSPSYILAMPSADPLADLLRKVLPERRAYAAVRWKNARIATAIYSFCRKYPARARAMLRRGARSSACRPATT